MAHLKKKLGYYPYLLTVLENTEALRRKDSSGGGQFTLFWGFVPPHCRLHPPADGSTNEVISLRHSFLMEGDFVCLLG